MNVASANSAQSVFEIFLSYHGAQSLRSIDDKCHTAMFLPRDAMLKRGLCCRPVSVRPSVCHQRRIQEFSFFWGDSPFSPFPLPSSPLPPFSPPFPSPPLPYLPYLPYPTYPSLSSPSLRSRPLKSSRGLGGAL